MIGIHFLFGSEIWNPFDECGRRGSSIDRTVGCGEIINIGLDVFVRIVRMAPRQVW
jgi:hypothetical protein